MSGVNKVILIGNLGADPDLRQAGNGSVCELRVATNESWTDPNGDRKEHTEWHRVVVWGKRGEVCAEHLSKGRQVYIEGKLKTRSWDDKDGNKRSTTEVVAKEVVFLSGRGEDQGQRREREERHDGRGHRGGYQGGYDGREGYGGEYGGGGYSGSGPNDDIPF